MNFVAGPLAVVASCDGFTLVPNIIRNAELFHPTTKRWAVQRGVK